MAGWQTSDQSRVPTAVIAPKLESYLAQFEVDPNEASPKRILAERAGVLYDTLDKIMEQRHATVDFLTADKLFCAMGDPIHHWRSHPALIAAYWEGLVPPDPTRPQKCANPECDVWFEVPDIPNTGAIKTGTKTGHQRYCSKNCSTTASRRRNPKAHSRAVKKCRNKSKESREAYNRYMREYRARKRQEREAA